MSHYIAVSDLPPDGERLQAGRFTAWKSILALTGLAGLVASLFLFLSGPETANSFAYSYLFAFEVFFTMTVGSLFWMLLHNASNSSWGVAIRRIPETLVLAFLPLFVLSIPLFGLPIPGVGTPDWANHVWEWIGIHHGIQSVGGGTSLRAALAENHDTLLLYQKYPFLHLGFDSIVPGWDFRILVYFAGFIWIASTLRGYSLEQDATGQVQPTYSARRFACGTLPLLAVFSTFASIDWIKSLNYKWFSTMFGVNIFAGSALSSMALVILIAGVLVKTGHLKHVVTAEHFHLMGKLMHAFVIFWAYIAFSQFFLIWYADIPEETQFYAIRNTGGWWYFSLGLTILHFALPFVLLLKRDAKRKLNYVMACAAFIIGVHMLELYWMIIPERGRALYDFSSAPDAGRFFRDIVFDLVAFLTFAGIYGYLLIRNLGKSSLYPCGDPRLEESVNVVS